MKPVIFVEWYFNDGITQVIGGVRGEDHMYNTIGVMNNFSNDGSSIFTFNLVNEHPWKLYVHTDNDMALNTS